MIGHRKATESNLYLPNLNGVDANDFKEGYLSVLRGGNSANKSRSFNAITVRSGNGKVKFYDKSMRKSYFETPEKTET